MEQMGQSQCIGQVNTNDESVIESGSRVIVWCAPRSISTALLKCLSAVDGIEVWFEPFYRCLAIETPGTAISRSIESGAVEKGDTHTKTCQQLETFDANCSQEAKLSLSYSSVKHRLENSTSRHVFVKDISVAMTRVNFEHLPKGYRHTFLIRHPLRVFASLRKAVTSSFSDLGLLRDSARDEATFDIGRDHPLGDGSQMGVRETYELWKYVRENLESDPIVIDGDELLANPAEVLSKYCEAADLPYDKSLLTWDASVAVLNKWIIVGDGSLEKLIPFYGRALRSSHFSTPSEIPSRDHVTPDVIRCTDEVMKYYEEMYQCRLKLVT
ncbi:uncharacterized protein [Diadema antillarum]|uniref:uncharacterized protein n=1 Tax=Diadema antillarum TaxID=105358 RepID=UPI003A872BE0